MGCKITFHCDLCNAEIKQGWVLIKFNQWEYMLGLNKDHIYHKLICNACAGDISSCVRMKRIKF